MAGMFPLLFALLLQAQASRANSFAPLTAYEGAWTVHAEHPFSPGVTADTLINRCRSGEAFYTCEQIVNGHSTALVVFTLTTEPGHYEVSNVLPDGHASSGSTTLTVNGSHWTYLSRNAERKPTFRVENTFTDANHIHFEMFSTTDAGATWTRVNQGDDTRNAGTA